MFSRLHKKLRNKSGCLSFQHVWWAFGLLQVLLWPASVWKCARYATWAMAMPPRNPLTSCRVGHCPCAHLRILWIGADYRQVKRCSCFPERAQGGSRATSSMRFPGMRCFHWRHADGHLPIQASTSCHRSPLVPRSVYCPDPLAIPFVRHAVFGGPYLPYVRTWHYAEEASDSPSLKTGFVKSS